MTNIHGDVAFSRHTDQHTDPAATPTHTAIHSMILNDHMHASGFATRPLENIHIFIPFAENVRVRQKRSTQSPAKVKIRERKFLGREYVGGKRASPCMKRNPAAITTSPGAQLRPARRPLNRTIALHGSFRRAIQPSSCNLLTTTTFCYKPTTEPPTPSSVKAGGGRGRSRRLVVCRLRGVATGREARKGMCVVGGREWKGRARRGWNGGHNAAIRHSSLPIRCVMSDVR